LFHTGSSPWYIEHHTAALSFNEKGALHAAPYLLNPNTHLKWTDSFEPHEQIHQCQCDSEKTNYNETKPVH
jgi:hypothetical protein